MEDAIEPNRQPTIQPRNDAEAVSEGLTRSAIEEIRMMKAIKDVGLQFWNVVDNLEKTTTKSRELSLAKTKIEEAVMWATKHLTA